MAFYFARQQSAAMAPANSTPACRVWISRNHPAPFASMLPTLVGSAIATVLVALSAIPSSSRADTFFAGRQLTLLLGGGVGGSVDIYGRLVARHIVRHLDTAQPPSIVVRNYPASGGVQAYMALATTAANDGSIFAIAARGPLTDPLWSDKPCSASIWVRRRAAIRMDGGGR